MTVWKVENIALHVYERGNMQDVTVSGGVMHALDTLAAGSAQEAWAEASMWYRCLDAVHELGERDSWTA